MASSPIAPLDTSADWMSADPRSDAALLADKAAPADSFAVFYRRHVHALIRFAASRGLTAEAAADVVSETFLSALRGRSSYRPHRENARIWLLTIEARRIADMARMRERDTRRLDRMLSELHTLAPADIESYDRLAALGSGPGLDALADLPAAQQQAIRSRILEDRDYTDVAAALGVSQAAARQHVSRGLAALRRNLRRTS